MRASSKLRSPFREEVEGERFAPDTPSAPRLARGGAAGRGRPGPEGTPTGGPPHHLGHGSDLEFRPAIYCKVVPISKSLYSVHPSVAANQKWIASLKEKTGRSLDEWLKLVKKSGPPTENELRAWLKSQQGLATMSAWWIAEYAGG